MYMRTIYEWLQNFIEKVESRHQMKTYSWLLIYDWLRMNINQIKYCVAVFENKSFSLAAKAEGVSVQAVSKAIGDLEKELGAKLFDRFNRGTLPTALGRSFYLKARPALAAFAELEAFSDPETQAAIQPKVLTLGLCSPEFDQFDTYFEQIATFLKKNANIEVRVSLANPRTAHRKLETGTYDALITLGRYLRDDVDCVTVGTLPTGVVVSAEHPLAKKKMVNLSDLQPYPAGESRTFDSFNESILNLYRSRGLITNTKTVDGYVESIHRFVTKENGYFFSVVLPMVAKSGSNRCLLAINPKEQVGVPVCIVSLKDRKSQAHHELESYLIQTVDALANC